MISLDVRAVKRKAMTPGPRGGHRAAPGLRSLRVHPDLGQAPSYLSLYPLTRSTPL